MRIAWLSIGYAWLASFAAAYVPALEIAMLPLVVVAVAAALPTITRALPRTHTVDGAPVVGAMLGLAIGLAIAAGFAAAVPSIESESPAYPISANLGPLLGLVTAIAGTAALRRPSPCRIAVAAMTLLCAWPFWLGIHGFTVMVFEDHKHDLVAPWTLALIRIAATPLPLLGIGLGLIAVRSTAAALPACRALPDGQ